MLVELCSASVSRFWNISPSKGQTQEKDVFDTKPFRSFKQEVTQSCLTIAEICYFFSLVRMIALSFLEHLIWQIKGFKNYCKHHRPKTTKNHRQKTYSSFPGTHITVCEPWLSSSFLPSPWVDSESAPVVGWRWFRNAGFPPISQMFKTLYLVIQSDLFGMVKWPF